MQSWLHDNFELLIIVLSIAALVLATAWWRTRKRAYALTAGAAVVLMGCVWLLVHLLPLLFGESDSQQIERKVREMAAAVKDRDLERIFSHISRDFNYHGQDRAAFRQRSSEVLRSHKVDEVIVWEFQRGDIARGRRTGTVQFMVKARGNWQGSEAGYLCRANFVLDPDGQWRMQGFKISNPFMESEQEIRIPGF